MTSRNEIVAILSERSPIADCLCVICCVPKNLYNDTPSRVSIVRAGVFLFFVFEMRALRVLYARLYSFYIFGHML